MKKLTPLEEAVKAAQAWARKDKVPVYIWKYSDEDYRYTPNAMFKSATGEEHGRVTALGIYIAVDKTLTKPELVKWLRRRDPDDIYHENMSIEYLVKSYTRFIKGKYRIEVIADASGVWAGNAALYPTQEEAKSGVIDLMSRWLLVRQWRVVNPDAVICVASDV